MSKIVEKSKIVICSKTIEFQIFGLSDFKVPTAKPYILYISTDITTCKLSRDLVLGIIPLPLCVSMFDRSPKVRTWEKAEEGGEGF